MGQALSQDTLQSLSPRPHVRVVLLPLVLPGLGDGGQAGRGVRGGLSPQEPDAGPRPHQVLPDPMSLGVGRMRRPNRGGQWGGSAPCRHSPWRHSPEVVEHGQPQALPDRRAAPPHVWPVGGFAKGASRPGAPAPGLCMWTWPLPQWPLASESPVCRGPQGPLEGPTWDPFGTQRPPGLAACQQAGQWGEGPLQAVPILRGL